MPKHLVGSCFFQTGFQYVRAKTNADGTEQKVGSPILDHPVFAMPWSNSGSIVQRIERGFPSKPRKQADFPDKKRSWTLTDCIGRYKFRYKFLTESAHGIDPQSFRITLLDGKVRD